MMAVRRPDDVIPKPKQNNQIYKLIDSIDGETNVDLFYIFGYQKKE